MAKNAFVVEVNLNYKMGDYIWFEIIEIYSLLHVFTCYITRGLSLTNCLKC